MMFLTIAVWIYMYVRRITFINVISGQEPNRKILLHESWPRRSRLKLHAFLLKHVVQLETNIRI